MGCCIEDLISTALGSDLRSLDWGRGRDWRMWSKLSSGSTPWNADVNSADERWIIWFFVDESFQYPLWRGVYREKKGHTYIFTRNEELLLSLCVHIS